MLQSCQYDPHQHEILNTELSYYIRKAAPPAIAPHLFVYRHRKENTFVIAKWVGAGRFVDVMNLDNSLANFTHQRAQWLLQQLWKPLYRSDVARILRGKENDRIRNTTDAEREKAGRLFHQRKASIVVPGGRKARMYD